MSNKKHFSDTYHAKEDEKKAFSDYAPYRYGEVEIDPADERRRPQGLDTRRFNSCEENWPSKVHSNPGPVRRS